MLFPAMPAIARVYVDPRQVPRSWHRSRRHSADLTDVPNPTDRIYRQTGTDLAVHEEAGDDHGYVFYVEPGPLPGQSLAYLGPDVRSPFRSRR